MAWTPGRSVNACPPRRCAKFFSQKGDWKERSTLTGESYRTERREDSFQGGS